jgi:N utilization substance protein A
VLRVISPEITFLFGKFNDVEMQTQFIAAVNQLVAEKNLPKETVLEVIEAAFKTAYRKDYGTKDQEILVELSETGESANVFLQKEVVEKVENEDLEISEKDAKKYNKKAKVGDMIKIDVTPMEYGRIAAQSAKQVIMQKLQEAERNLMYETFKDRENELLNTQVHRVQGDRVYIDMGKIILELPREHKIPGERYYAGQRLKLYLDKVMKTTKGPRLVISRTHPDLVRKLLELEIPEIAQGTVEVKKIARDPGMRCKIAVTSNDEKVDPVGACVGQKGVRVQSIMDELNGERIDVIPYTEDKLEFLRQSMEPAKISYIDLNEEQGRVKVYVEDSERAMAIGRKGQNVRLASKLNDIEIDILDISELSDEDKKRLAPTMKATKSRKSEDGEETEVEIAEVMLSELDVDPSYVEALENAGLTMVSQLKGLSAEDLQYIEGLGEEGAAQVFDAVKEA